jgi:hypothetical protein
MYWYVIERDCNSARRVLLSLQMYSCWREGDQREVTYPETYSESLRLCSAMLWLM